MFNQVKDFKLACPRCGSENIYVGRMIKVNDKDDVKCNDCSYSQYAKPFKDKWTILNSKRERG